MQHPLSPKTSKKMPKNLLTRKVFIKGQLQRFYKLMSHEKAFKMLRNDMLKSAKPFSSCETLRMGREILVKLKNLVSDF